MKRVDAIQSLTDRVKRIETKLGAVSQRESATREDAETASIARPKALELSQAAVPSTYWSEEAGIITAACDAPILRGRFQIAVIPEKIDEIVRLHRFAAKITKWWEDTNRQRGLEDYLRLDEIITDFVVGEQPPSTGIAGDQEKPTC